MLATTLPLTPPRTPSKPARSRTSRASLKPTATPALRKTSSSRGRDNSNKRSKLARSRTSRAGLKLTATPALHKTSSSRGQLVLQSSNVFPLSFLKHLPFKLLLNILQFATDEVLAATAHVSHQLRRWSADIFLERTTIIDLHSPSACLNLKAVVLCHPVLLSLLLTTPQCIKTAIHLQCDLFDLVQYHAQVKIAFSLLARFTSVEIRFNTWEMNLLKDAWVPSALISALASAESVSQLGISSSFVSSPPRFLVPPIVAAGGAPLQKVEQLMDAMEKVSLYIDFMSAPQLRDSCRAFLSSSNLRYLTLNNVTSESLQDSLPFIRLPALTHLLLYSGSDRLILPSHFFQCHAHITHLSVVSHSFQHDDTPTAEMLRIQRFPPLVSLSLSSNHYNWVLDPRGPSLLQIQPQDMFPLITSSDAFCNAVRSLTRPLHMVRVNGYSKRLLIRFPDGIEQHVDGQPLSLACCGCGEERIPGISTVELETQSLHASTVHFLSMWVKIFPSLTRLRVDSQNQPTCTRVDFMRFLSSTLQSCPDLVVFECPKEGTWRRTSREWYRV